MGGRSERFWQSRRTTPCSLVCFLAVAGTALIYVSSGPKIYSPRYKWRGGSLRRDTDSASRDQQLPHQATGEEDTIAKFAAQVSLLERQLLDTLPTQQTRSQAMEMPAASTFSIADLAAAVSADLAQLPLVRAGRQLRKGVKAVVTLDAQPSAEQQAEAAAEGEIWRFYPNDLPKRSAYSGDTRWVLTPFLAHKALNGTGYKWLLFGGADTVFFTEPVLQMLEGFDHRVPYIITDNLWWGGQHGGPYKGAPRCLPCHSAANSDLLLLTQGFQVTKHKDSAPLRPRDWAFAAPAGCPCTPQLLCEDAPELVGDARNQENARCEGDVPFPASKGYSIHGGAGVILSIGLLEQLSFEEMEECVRRVSIGGGETFLTECLWIKGFAPTDPGFSVYRPSARLFDPFQWTGHDDTTQGHGAWEMTNRMKWDVSPEDTCNLECQDLLHYMVSAHVASSVQPSMEEAARELRRLAAKYAWWWDSHKRDSEPSTIYWSIDAAIT